MNKKVFGRKLSRGSRTREALFVSLIKSLVATEKIVTTKAKAKAIKGQLERYLSLAKKGTLAARRRVLADLDNNSKTTNTLFDRKFKSVKLIGLPARKGDNAQMVRLELTGEVKEAVKEEKNENVSTKTKRS